MLDNGKNSVILLLPALPTSTDWNEGNVIGLSARNGFEVNFDWTDGKYHSNKTIQTKLPFSALQLKEKYKMRNLWEKEDLGVFENEIQTGIPAHGIVMVQMFEQK
jgi:hypothetical protein